MKMSLIGETGITSSYFRVLVKKYYVNTDYVSLNKTNGLARQPLKKRP